jgi:hypothetical protein
MITFIEVRTLQRQQDRGWPGSILLTISVMKDTQRKSIFKTKTIKLSQSNLKAGYRSICITANFAQTTVLVKLEYLKAIDHAE